MHRRRFVIILVLSLWSWQVSWPLCAAAQQSRHAHGLLYQYFLRSCPWNIGDAPQPGPVYATDDPLQDAHPLTPLVKVPTPPPKTIAFFA